MMVINEVVLNKIFKNTLQQAFSAFQEGSDKRINQPEPIRFPPFSSGYISLSNQYFFYERIF